MSARGTIDQDRRDRQYTALAAALLIGASFGVIGGYFVYGVSAGAEGGAYFRRWIAQPISYGALWWGLYGAAVAGALIYIKRSG